jgi:hypothetical protein
MGDACARMAMIDERRRASAHPLPSISSDIQESAGENSVTGAFSAHQICMAAQQKRSIVQRNIRAHITVIDGRTFRSSSLR